jgi:hypothetical protein
VVGNDTTVAGVPPCSDDVGVVIVDMGVVGSAVALSRTSAGTFGLAGVTGDASNERGKGDNDAVFDATGVVRSNADVFDLVAGTSVLAPFARASSAELSVIRDDKTRVGP